MTSKLIGVIQDGTFVPATTDGNVLVDWREHRSPAERRYDLADASPAQLAAAMTALAAELKALTCDFGGVRDLTCDLNHDPRSGRCSLHFRAIR